MIRHRSLFAAALIILSAALPVRAQLPSTTLSVLQPPGGKIGTTFEVAVAVGDNADGAERLLFSHPGIKAVAKSEPSALFPGERDVVPGKFMVAVAADVPPGIYDARLAGPLGVSNPRGFAIDVNNEIREGIDNRTAEKAQVIEVGSIVSGNCDADKEDWYKFPAKQGTRVLIDVQAQRIDSKTDATLVLYDAAGRELARCRDFHRRDPFIDFVVPGDGDYFVKVYDFVYAGGSDYFYRLAVHSNAYLDFAFPPVVRRGEKNKLTIYGRNLPGGSTSDVVVQGRPLERLDVTVDVPAKESSDQRAAPSPVRAVEALSDGREFRLQTPAGPTNAVLLGYTSLPIVAEAEPNNTLEKTPTVTLPCEVVGQFFPRGDVDAVQFEAKKGEVVVIEVLAQRQGFISDPWLLVQRVTKDAAGKTVLTDLNEVDDNATNIGATAFDAATSDPYYRLSVSQDGTYRVVVRDLHGNSRGEARLMYRLVLRKPQPDFRIIAMPVTIAKGSNNTSGVGYRSAGVFLRSGEVSPFTVMASRIDGFDGPIQLSVEGLPPGVTVPEIILGAKSDMTPLTISVPENSKPWQGTIRIFGRATIDGREVRHEARAGAILAPGSNKRSAEARMAQEFALGLGGNETMPCLVQAGDGKTVRVERGSKATVPVKMIRRGDFQGSVTLTPIGLPSYAKAATVVVGEKEMTLTIEVDKSAPLGELTFAISGVIPKYNYTRNKNDIDDAAKRTEAAAQAAAALAKEIDRAKAQAAAASKEKKAEADQALAAATEKMKKAADAKKVIDLQAAAVTRAGQVKAVTNVPVVSTLMVLDIVDPPATASKK
jgi:hypothetical protein